MPNFNSGNIFVRTGILSSAGSQTAPHRHNFDHTTFVMIGAIKIEKLEETGEVNLDGQPIFRVVADATRRAPPPAADQMNPSTALYNWVLVRANTWHRLTAVDAGAAYLCVFSHRDPQTGEIVQEWTGWEKAIT